MHFSLYQNSMVISSKNRVFIKVLRQEKGYGSKKLLAEFPKQSVVADFSEASAQENRHIRFD